MNIISTFGMPGISAGSIRVGCKNIKELKTDNNHAAGLEDIIYHIIRCGLVLCRAVYTMVVRCKRQKSARCDVATSMAPKGG